MISPKNNEIISTEEPVQDVDSYVQVLVVGGGPTGLTLANQLGEYGTPTLLIDRNAVTVSEPRAVSIDDESLRTMQSIDLSEIVLSHIVAGYGSDYLMPSGRCFLSVDPTGRPYGFPRRNAFSQPRLEAQLRDGLERFSSVSVMFSWSLDKFSQNDLGVRAVLSGPNGAIKTVQCEYLIGCDGASSAVRRELGIRLEGKSFEERWLIIDLADSSCTRRKTVVFCNPDRPCIALPGPNRTRRFEFKLTASEQEADVLQSDFVSKLLRDHDATETGRVVRKVVYTFHARVAPVWSVGRVFLAGDAAHLTPPFAGQGMNSGLRDATNISWKLALVTAGKMSPTLLSTYGKERREHAWQMIRLALRMGKIMSPPSRLTGMIVQNAFVVASIWPFFKGYFGEMRYKPAPLFKSGFMVPDRFNRRRTIVGRMLPQPQVIYRGASLPLDDLLGRGFALIGIGVPVTDILNVRRELAIAAFSPNCVALDPPDQSDETAVATATIVDRRLEFERYRGQLLLVRPDRYVAATGSSKGRYAIGAAIHGLSSFVVNHTPPKNESSVSA